MHSSHPPPYKLAVLASGAGSNALKLIEYFRGSAVAEVALIGCNKPGAGVLAIAQQHGIPSFIIERERFFAGDGYTVVFQQAGIHLIVLAGFLWKIPQTLLDAYPKKLINIHPALLPKYGGRGMYGQHVHEAVRASGDAESGITIHYVDEQYDHGDTIFQARCAVQPGDDAQAIAKNVQQLEHYYYPKVIEDVLRKEPADNSA